MVISTAFLWLHYSGFQASCDMSHMFIWYCNSRLFWLHCSDFQELGVIHRHTDSKVIS
jgi:hypothetical protein